MGNELVQKETQMPNLNQITQVSPYSVQSTSITVHCPFCKHFHTHGYSNADIRYTRKLVRLGHCFKDVYEINLNL